MLSVALFFCGDTEDTFAGLLFHNNPARDLTLFDSDNMLWKKKYLERHLGSLYPAVPATLNIIVLTDLITCSLC